MRTITIPPARHGGCMCILHSTPRAGLPRSAASALNIMRILRNGASCPASMPGRAAVRSLARAHSPQNGIMLNALAARARGHAAALAPPQPAPHGATLTQ